MNEDSPSWLVDEHCRLLAVAGLGLGLCVEFDLGLDAGEGVESAVSSDSRVRLADQSFRYSALKACLGNPLAQAQRCTSYCWVSGVG